jgi:peptidoglycan/LPS O-acetylase OafA/YrhL
LRALAIMLVMLLHAGAPFTEAGYVGVEVFFVLSGYLITSILMEEHARSGSISLAAFYMRRAWRLYPALLLFLAVYWAVAPQEWPGYPHGRDVFGAAFYLMDYAVPFAHWGRYLGHAWSLGVEEKFYLLWPVILLASLRVHRARDIARGLLVAAAVSFLWMLFNLRASLPVYTRFDTRLPGLVLGCWLAMRSVAGPLVPGAIRPRIAGWGGVLLLVFALATGHRTGPAVMYFTIPLAEMAALGLIAGASSLPLSHPWLAWIGRMSYGIYLWHVPIMAALKTSLPWWQAFVLGGGAATLAAWISYSTVEAAVRARRRHAPRLVAGVPASADS